MRCLTPAAGRVNRPAAAGHIPSWLCCTSIAQAHKTSRVKLPNTELLWTGACPFYANTCRAVFPVCQHSQGRVPLIPHTCRAVFPLMPPSRRVVIPLCHTLAGPCSPYATHLQGRVPLMPLTSKAVFPPYATHSQGRAAKLPEQSETFISLSPLWYQ